MITLKPSRIFLPIFLILSIIFFPDKQAYAMHIMEGYLAPRWCVLWAILSLPFLIYGFISIRKSIELSSKHLLLLAMCGAFAFLLSALKMPSVTGSSSHATGVALGAILFGPTAMTVVGAIILLFQAILLAHGGVTTLGANVFSMAIVGTFTAYFVFRFARYLKISAAVCVFLAAFFGDLITYTVTSGQLAIAYPDTTGGVAFSFIKFMSIFAVPQIALASVEGILSVVVYNILVKYSKRELTTLSAI